jgi:hypothetical protein
MVVFTALIVMDSFQKLEGYMGFSELILLINCEFDRSK